MAHVRKEVIHFGGIINLLEIQFTNTFLHYHEWVNFRIEILPSKLLASLKDVSHLVMMLCSQWIGNTWANQTCLWSKEVKYLIPFNWLLYFLHLSTRLWQSFILQLWFTFLSLFINNKRWPNPLLGRLRWRHWSFVYYFMNFVNKWFTINWKH